MPARTGPGSRRRRATDAVSRPPALSRRAPGEIRRPAAVVRGGSPSVPAGRRPPRAAARARRPGSGLTVLLVACLGALSVAGCEGVVDPVPRAPAIEAPDESAVPGAERDRYRLDAARLALRWASEGRRLETLPVEIPEDARRSLYAALLHVHAATDLPARDTVVEVHAVHTFPRPELREVLIIAEADAEWVAAWERGERLTGYEPVDVLVRGWDLEPVRFHAWSTGPGAVLRSARPLNVAALAARFEEIEGIRSARPNGAVGDGNDIEAESESGGWRLDYSVGWGDCPAGCIHRHHWLFRVKTDGTVRFLESRGPAVP